MNSIKSRLFLLMFWVTSWTLHTPAQSVMNPDISAIPRFRIESSDGADLPARRVFSRPVFSLEEFELALQAYLNPYARADIFLAKAGVGDEPIELEEVYATILRGLPLDLNVRVGKYLAEYGKLNMLHPHAWPFLSKPLALERFLGEEGLNDLGISVSYVIPTGDLLYTRLTADILKGETIAKLDPSSGNLSGGPGLIDTVAHQATYANSLRLMVFIPVSDNSDLEIGLSGLTGVHDPYRKYRFYYANLDFKYKWKPNAYTSFVLQGEGLLNNRTINDGTVNGKRLTTGGFYIYGDYQFHKVFSLGARYDWSESPYASDEKAQAVAAFFGFYPVEETTAIRLQYQHTRTEAPIANALSINTISLQLVFSLGPHKAHPF